jgi:PAS domain S-box-containing protein
MNQDLRSSARGYLIALASCGLATLGFVLTSLWFGPRVTTSFYLGAVIVSSRFGGLGPGIAATLFGLAMVTYHQSTLSTAYHPVFYFLIGIYFVLALVLVAITELERRARKRASDVEVRLLLALEAGRLGYWDWDLKTNRVRSSETQAKIHGRPPHETETRIEDSGRNIHTDDRLNVQTAIERAMRNEAADRTSYRVVWPDGSIHWVEAVGRVFCDDAGTPTHVMGVCLDNTERLSAERRFRDIYEQAPLGIGIIDSRTGMFQQINPRYAQIIGRTEEEMRRLSFPEITHPDDLAEDLEQMENLRNGSIRRFQMQKRLLRGDGTYMWANLTVVPMWQVGEQVSFHLAMVEDITDRKTAEDNLKEREAQLTGILDHTTAIVYLKDADGRYLITNRRYRDLFEHDGESKIGKRDAEIFPAEVAQTFVESDNRVWREQKPLDFEEDAPHPDGLHTYRSIKFPVRDEAGAMIALGGISTDVTDLKQAHEDLIAKQGLLRNLIEVQEDEKQFLCREFHDGLIQYAVGSLMLLESRPELLNAGEAATKTIRAVIENLRRGVEDGRRTIRGIRPAVLDDSGLKAAMDDLIEQFATSGIHVTSKCDESIGRLPETIQTTVYRVVQEAVNNAKKYSGTDVVRIEMKQSGSDLHLQVRDFGNGVDVDAARKRGFGILGMTERVRLLGGDFEIESRPESGTCISARIPLPADYDE